MSQEQQEQALLATARGEPVLRVSPTKHDYNQKHKATEWHGAKSIKVNERPKPILTDPCDAILRITSTCICGSDLHLYHASFPGMRSGDVLGHEFMGEIVALGPDVKKFKKGDRAVSAFAIGCDICFYCKHLKLYCECDSTNPSKEEEAMYGHRTGGFHGYTHLTGGWEGGQAEYARVPFADTNLLKVPDGMPDDKVILLSDIAPTAWFANELGQVGKGDIVAVWGAGPVGQLCAYWARFRGAARVILIDNIQYRLDFARKHMPDVDVVNFDQEDVPTAVHALVGINAPDVGLEAVGVHYAKTTTHKMEMKLKLETDPSDTINEMIYTVRKGGRLGIIGAYAGYTNHFNIGAYMEKGQCSGAGQCPVQRYWHFLLELIQSGKADVSWVITHRPPLVEAPKAYEVFDAKADGVIKVVMKPGIRPEQVAAA